MVTCVKRIIFYLIFTLMFVFTVIIFEFIRSIWLLNYIKLFLDYKDYRYLSYAFLYQYVASTLELCIAPEIYNAYKYISSGGSIGQCLKRFLYSYIFVILFVIFVLITGYRVIQSTDYRVDPFGRPIDLLVMFGRYLLILNILAYIVAIIHYSVSPLIYMEKKPRIIISYIRGIITIKRYFIYIFLYLVIGLFLSLLISWFFGGITRFIFRVYGIDYPLYYDESILVYSKTRPKPVEFALENIAYVSSVVEGLIFFIIYLLLFYRRFIKKIEDSWT